MLEFLRPIVSFSIGLYLIFGLLCLFFLRLMWLARKDRTRSIFTLERENANVRLTRYFAGFMFAVASILGVYYLNLVTPQIVPPPQITPTPTPILELPPTPTPPPLLPTPTVTPTPLPPPTPAEATFQGTPVFIPTPNNSRGGPPNCPNPGSIITQPGNGAKVAGVVQIMGAATVDKFDYYKFEFKEPTTGEWVFVNLFNTPVQSGVLGQWNSDTVPPGEYEFRLVVVDGTGNFPEPCVVRLIVQ